MSRFNLRQKPRVCYFEPEEDEYIFCDPCGDYVYEYCSVHGPLLIIPDNKVPDSVTPSIPRASLTIPHVFLHLAPSSIPGAGLGVYARLTLPRGVRFGPYRGKYTNDVQSKYCWQIYDHNNRPSHLVDAADENDSNWMRYVNCSRHWFEQNLVAYQYKGQLYYRTIQIIPRHTELLVFYGTEFASSLQIDLKHYSSPVGFSQKAPETEENGTKELIVSSVETVEPLHNFPEAVNVYENSDDLSNEVLSRSITQDSQATSSSLETGSNITTVICNECNSHFDSKPSLIQHLQTHNENYKKHFENSNVEGFAKHVTSSQISDVQQPNTIDRNNNYNSKETLTYSAKQNYPYTLCPPTFEYQLLTNTRILNNSENNCLNKIHPDLFSTNNHLQSNKTDLQAYKKKPQCSICKKTFSSNHSLKRHLLLHTENKVTSCNVFEGKPQCSLCKKTFSSNHCLKRHLLLHTENKVTSCNVFEGKPQCSLCKKTFSSNHCLKRHLLLHTEKKVTSCNVLKEKPQCSICKKTFISNYNLKIHFLLLHTVKESFPCSICNRNYVTNDITKPNTPEKQLYCTVCKKIQFSSNFQNRFSCSVCHKVFMHNYKLTDHLKIHTEGKLFTCTVCEKKFRLKKYLQLHLLRIHSDEKPFSCTLCGKTFSENYKLKVHSVVSHSKST